MKEGHPEAASKLREPFCCGLMKEGHSASALKTNEGPPAAASTIKKRDPAAASTMKKGHPAAATTSMKEGHSQE